MRVVVVADVVTREPADDVVGRTFGDLVKIIVNELFPSRIWKMFGTYGVFLELVAIVVDVVVVVTDAGPGPDIVGLLRGGLGLVDDEI